MTFHMPVIKHWTRLLIRQWLKSFVGFTVICFIVTYSFWIYNRRNEKNQQDIHTKKSTLPSEDKVFYVDYTKTDEILNSALAQVTHIHTCPACLGKTICNNIMKQDINISGTMKNRGAINNREKWFDYNASNGKRMQIGIASFQDWMKFEDFICRNSSQPLSCKLSSAVHKSILGNKNFFTVRNLLNLHQAVEMTRSDFPLLVCATENLKKKLIVAFDEDQDAFLNEEEQIHMFTSLLVHPSYVLMMLRSRAGLILPVPKTLGSCGRVAIRETNWAPLTDSLKEPFEVRAGLALQVLQAIEDFQEEDSDWYILNTHFSYESLMVTKEGEVLLTELEDVALVDKNLFSPRLPNLLDLDGELCNEVCFQKFTKEILEGNNANSSICSRIPHYGQLMYALTCKQLLSDLEEHKTEGFFNFDGNKVHKKSKYPGLLHSIPEKDKESIEDLLRECVQETSSGGRKQAIEELRESLEKYLNYEDDDDEARNNHQDDTESQ